MVQASEWSEHCGQQFCKMPQSARCLNLRDASNGMIKSRRLVENQITNHLLVNPITSIKLMGESKRRKETLGEKYGQEQNILPWLPITKRQGEQFVLWTTRGAWAGIGLLVFAWITIRFIGPGFGWWHVD